MLFGVVIGEMFIVGGQVLIDEIDVIKQSVDQCVNLCVCVF